jgi:hypothetical protein
MGFLAMLSNIPLADAYLIGGGGLGLIIIIVVVVLLLRR